MTLRQTNHPAPERRTRSAARADQLSSVPQMDEQFIERPGFDHLAWRRDPERLGCFSKVDQEARMAGLELRGLVVFVGELGTVPTQSRQLLGSSGAAGTMNTVNAHLPRRTGAGRVRPKVHRASGCGDRVRHGILLPHMQGGAQGFVGLEERGDAVPGPFNSGRLVLGRAPRGGDAQWFLRASTRGSVECRVDSVRSKTTCMVRARIRCPSQVQEKSQYTLCLSTRARPLCTAWGSRRG